MGFRLGFRLGLGFDRRPHLSPRHGASRQEPRYYDGGGARLVRVRVRARARARVGASVGVRVGVRVWVRAMV